MTKPKPPKPKAEVKIIPNLLSHVKYYSQFGQKYLELNGYLNQFSNESISFDLAKENRIQVTKEAAENVIKNWKLVGEEAEFWKNRVGGTIAYENQVAPDKEIESSGEINNEKVRKFFIALWNKRKVIHQGHTLRFIDQQIEYLNSFDQPIKKEFEDKIEPFISHLLKARENQNTIDEQALTNPQRLSDMFVEPDFKKYITPLTTCGNPLLKVVNDTYVFIGNSKTERGVIGAWFKALKARGKIHSSINRNVMAQILSREIKKYSISAASIDNTSAKFHSTYERLH